jgi:hypothetical protein
VTTQRTYLQSEERHPCVHESRPHPRVALGFDWVPTDTVRDAPATQLAPYALPLGRPFAEKGVDLLGMTEEPHLVAGV